jgi:hypothetical protein
MDSIQTALAAEGQPLESYWPYLPAQPAPGAWTAPAGIGQVWTSNSKRVPATFGEVSRLLAAGTPVVLGLIITEAFTRCDATGQLPDLKLDPLKGGHAVLAVGHGTDAGGTSYILIRNSWSEHWGMDGHAWLAQSYIDAQLCEALIIAK